MHRIPASPASRSAIGLVLVGLLASTGCGPSPSQATPDVVLITLDTLRPDYLGFLGFEHDTAPFLGNLAESSVVLEEAVSTSSWTTPATASIFTGVYPNRHQLLAGLRAHAGANDANGETITLHSIRPSLATLPQLLQGAGYRTYGLASNPNIREELGFTRGFDRFECRSGAAVDELVDTLIGWLPTRDSAEPRFIYLHFNDVHAPYLQRDPWYAAGGDERSDARQRYISEIGYIDSQLQRAFEHFGWDENAVVMVLSDHGEEFYEHGREGHLFSLHGELNRTLFLFRSPRPGFEPTRISARASLIDALPTLLELAGVAVPEGLDGRSLTAFGEPSRRGALEAELETRTLLAHRYQLRNERNLWAAMLGPWKMILSDDDEPARVYNRATDPGEQVVVESPDGDSYQALLDAILGYQALADSMPSNGEHEMKLDPTLVDQLRELGYVDGN